MSAAIRDAACNTQRYEQLQKQSDKYRADLTPEDKPGAPQYRSAALQLLDQLSDHQIHALWV